MVSIFGGIGELKGLSVSSILQQYGKYVGIDKYLSIFFLYRYLDIGNL